MVCALLAVCFPSTTGERLSKGGQPQTTLAQQEYDVIYGKTNLTVEVWENNPDKFFDDLMIWNPRTREWEAPLYWQLYWNGTGLDTPALENQYRGGELLFEADANSTFWVSMRPMDDGRNYNDYYLGPFLNYTGFATNAVVINTTNHEYEWNITAQIVPEHWNQSGWYFIGITGHSFFKHNETHYFDGDVGERRYFYFNITAEATMELPSALDQSPHIEFYDSWVSDGIVDTGTLVVVVFKARWNDTLEEITWGLCAEVYDGTRYYPLEYHPDGWALMTSYDEVCKRNFTVVSVGYFGERYEINGESVLFEQTVESPDVIWDRIQIVTENQSGCLFTSLLRDLFVGVLAAFTSLFTLTIEAIFR